MLTDIEREIIKLFFIENNNLKNTENLDAIRNINGYSESKLSFMIEKISFVVDMTNILYEDIYNKYNKKINKIDVVVLAVSICAILLGEEKRHYRNMFEELRLRNIYIYLKPYTSLLMDTMVDFSKYDVYKENITKIIKDSSDILSENTEPVLTYKKFKMVYDKKENI